MPVNIISIGGTELEEYINRVPSIANQSIRMAINSTASGKGMTLIKKSMLDEVAFPSGYLNGDRLKLTKRATSSLTARKAAAYRFACRRARPPT
jgi:hypothetical protein